MSFAMNIKGKKAQKLVEKGAMLIDVRDPVNYRDGTIPGAINMSLRQVSSLMKEPRTRSLIFFGESSDDKTLAAAINYASQFGFTNIYSLGTKDNWNE